MSQTLASQQKTVEPLFDREEVIGDPPPRHLQALLVRFGLRNMYREPNYRIAFAENIRRKVGCQLPIWEKDANGKLVKNPNQVIPIKEALQLMMQNVPAAEVHKHVLAQADKNNRPLRTEAPGPKWVKKYTFKGLVIEKWNAPERYGDPAMWESIKIEGYPILGPFPSRGDYELIGGHCRCDGKCWCKSFWPNQDRILQLLNMYEDIQHKQPESPQQRMLLRIAEWEEREKAEYEALRSQFDEECREMTDVLMNRVSLAARAYRSKLLSEKPYLHQLQ